MDGRGAPEASEVVVGELLRHGNSTVVNGRFAGGTREYRDAPAGWDWLVDVRGYAPNHVGLFGISIGAATALIATGEEPRVAAVWEDSSYADVDGATHTQAIELDTAEYERRLDAFFEAALGAK